MPPSSLKTPHHYPTPWGRAQHPASFFRAARADWRAKAGTNFRWFCQRGRARHPVLFLGSSVVEQPAVNRLVAGSIPARGATQFFLANEVSLEKRVSSGLTRGPIGRTGREGGDPGIRLDRRTHLSTVIWALRFRG